MKLYTAVLALICVQSNANAFNTLGALSALYTSYNTRHVPAYDTDADTEYTDTATASDTTEPVQQKNVYQLWLELTPQGSQHYQQFRASEHYNPSATGIMALDNLNIRYGATVADVFFLESRVAFILQFKTAPKNAVLLRYSAIPEVALANRR